MKNLFSKLSVKLIAIIAVVVVAVGGLTVALAKADVFTKPEVMVERALDSVTEADTEGAFESIFGWSELMQKVWEQGAETELKLSVSDIPGELLGLDGMTIPKAGISVSARNDAKNNKQSTDLSLELADTKLATIQLYADSKELQLAVPQFFTPVLSVPYASDDLAKKAQESYLGELLEISEEDFNMLASSFRLNTDIKEIAAEAEQLLQGWKELQKKLYADMSAKKNGSIVIAAAGDIKCKSYTATFPKEAVEEYVDESSKLLMNYMEKLWKQTGLETMMEKLETVETEETAESLPNWENFRAEYEKTLAEFKKELTDVTISIAVKDKRVVQLIGETGAGNENVFTCELLFGLEGSYMDNMTLTLTKHGDAEPLITMKHTTEHEAESLSSYWEVVSEGEKVTFGGTYDTVSGEFSMMFKADAVFMKLDGTVTELKKGEAIAAEISSISISEEVFEEITDLECSFSYKVFGGTVEPLSNAAKDIFEMEESDWNSLIMEVYGKLFGILGGLNGLFQ